MASYTTPLKTLIEQPTQYINDMHMDDRIEIGRQKLFDFDYPMFDERYKPLFERKFIEHFYDREIGFETEYLFKRRLKNWLNINMGYYSNLMESELLKFDPFINSRMDVTHTKVNDEISNTDRSFGETNSNDTIDATISDEDTTKVTDRDSTTDTTNNTETNMIGEVNGSSDGTSNTIDSGSEDTTSNTTQDTDSFKRDLHTDTPDTRLAITTNDGDGTVGYASDITESKTNEKQKTDATGHSETTGQSDTTTSDTTHTDSTQEQTTNEVGQSKEATDVTETGTRDETIDRTVGQTGKRDFDELTDGKINSLEDFVQNRVGKIGVQTYSKMLKEYRETFLRIERDIFDEMNILFMLVY